MSTRAAASPRAAALVASLAAVAVLGVVGLRSEVVEPVRISSGSMEPTLGRGDVVLVNKRARVPARGELIMFKSPQDGQRACKRVIGVSGDIVAIRDAVLFVNDVLVVEPYVDHESIDALYYGPVTVPVGSVLVMGDTRANSIDSRTYGDVALEDITGTVITRLWGWG